MSFKIERENQKVKFNYMEDYNLVGKPKICQIGQRVKLVADEIVDQSTGVSALLDATIIYVQKDTKYNFVWYYFKTDIEEFNTLSDNKFPEKYYKLFPDYSTKFILQ